MPKINKLELPQVSVSMTPDEIDDLAGKLSTEVMSMEGMIETAIYLQRQIELAKALDTCVSVLKGRIKSTYEKLPEDQRDTRRVRVGMATFTDASEKRDIIDRDKVVETLTDEQLRITYKPDIKAMETILKPGDLERLTKMVPVASKISIRDNRASEDYDELDF